jgi:type I restriction enzyme S subunit
VGLLLAEPLCNGISVKGSETPPGVPALKLNAMGEHGFDYKFIRYIPIPESVAVDLAVAEGDFFVSRGNGSLALVGRGTLAQAPPFRVVFPDTMIRLRFKEVIRESRWVPSIWSSRPVRKQIEGSVKTTAGIWKIAQPQVESIVIPLPPLAEQRRIVAAIEANLTRLDAGVANLRRVRAKLKRYRAAVLKAACEGRLVPTEAELARAEGRTYEPADRLLARILQARRERWEAEQLAAFEAQRKRPTSDKWKEKYREPVGPPSSSLEDLPEGWSWTTVDALLVEPPCNGISVKGSDTPPGVPALRLNAMSDLGFDYTAIRYLPIGEDIAHDLEIVEGDFFVSRGNGSLALVGRGTPAQEPPFQVVFPDTMIRLRFSPPVRSTKWIATIWSSALIRRQIEGMVKTTAGIWKIAQPQVASILIPLPPQAEQARIVAEVERRLSLIDELDAAASANLKRADRLRQSILKRAFEGKLVPQDVADEPAAALLERNRAGQGSRAPAPTDPSNRNRHPRRRETQRRLFDGEGEA